VFAVPMHKLKLGLVAAGASLALFAAAPSAADAACQSSGGGVGPRAINCGPTGHAKIVNGRAVAPIDAPRRVRRMVAAANRIDPKPYVYGGGHARWEDRGYDCSGSVSYVLHAAGLLASSRVAPGFYTFGRRGIGRWVTVWAGPGHVFIVIAGLRFDTSYTPGDGPGWSRSMRSTAGFRPVHPRGL
jgi:hypothetical protein